MNQERPTTQNRLMAQLSCPQTLAERLELQGECKVQKYTLLQFSCIKSILLFLLLTVSVIGLLLLKYYKSLRAKVFYNNNVNEGQATHVFIRGSGKRQDQIVELQKEGGNIYFYFKKLKYQLIGNKSYPIGLNYQTFLKQRLNEQYMKEGLKTQQVRKHASIYGKNQHVVDPPAYFEYLYEVMTEPFFFIQYLAAVIYIIEKMPPLSALLIGASIITTTINYIILYISYRKIKQIAQVTATVQVLRNQKFIELPSNELVPGDIFIPKKELYCDVILLKGQLYVNEANLTGQSIPIGKFGMETFSNYKPGDSSVWIFQGSIILSSHNALAMVVHTGYSSKKGRILRKILHRNPQSSHTFTTYIVFLFEIYAVGVLAYLGTMPMRISNDNLQPVVIFLNFLLIITFCFPPSAPIYFNLVYSFSLFRLKNNGILGTQPEKTVQSSNLKIMCFDKTGTLTEDKVQVNKVIKFNQENYFQIKKEQYKDSIDFKLFASCHTVKQFNEQLMGDQIDLKTFLHSGYKLCPSSSSSVCFQVIEAQGDNPNRIQIIKIYQYESKFQSMSVLALDKQTNKYYIFVKGAPEIIHNHSLTKFSYFDGLLQNESYSGFRTIGYGFKEVQAQKLNQSLHGSRQDHLADIEMLGILVFENKLKCDARQTIQRLTMAGIRSKIVTGDNIYIAIQTAIRCGILDRKDEIIVIQGKNISVAAEMPQSEIIFKAKIFRFEQQNVLVSDQNITYRNYLQAQNPIVVDNDFLKIRRDLKLSNAIKVYARVSPQNKAYIIKNIRLGIKKDREKLRWITKIFSDQEEKIGMVGDGANDLLAIKEANIGIGIRNCDSSYAASFSIVKLMDIDYIVRQAKCSQRQIIQICRFISVNGLLSVPTIIIMETEASFFSSFHLAFLNFTKYLIFPILIALSRPAATQTIYKPCSNFLRKQNQLEFWGNILFSTLAILATCLFYRSTPQYIRNYSRADVNSGWSYTNSLVASQFLYSCIQPIILVLCLYESAPWKEPIYKNILLFVALLLNLAFQIAYYFLQPQLSSFFETAPISRQNLLYLLIIGLGAGVLSLIWSCCIGAMKLHEQHSPPCLPNKQIAQAINTASSSQNDH